MDWIYLSPHFDDAALSCGGLIWEQAKAGHFDEVKVLTVCAGEVPPGPLSPFASEFHSRWRASAPVEEAGPISIVALRRQEDIDSCARLSASYHHLTIPDCIYRHTEDSPGGRIHLYKSREALFGALHPGEIHLVESLAEEFTALISPGSRIACPLALGNHVDHQLTRRAAERMGTELFYYADFPYAREAAAELERLDRSGWRRRVFPISPAGLKAWQEAVAAHRSQISTFWPDLEAMRDEVGAYCESNGGVVLWQPSYGQAQ